MICPKGKPSCFCGDVTRVTSLWVGTQESLLSGTLTNITLKGFKGAHIAGPSTMCSFFYVVDQGYRLVASIMPAPFFARFCDAGMPIFHPYLEEDSLKGYLVAFWESLSYKEGVSDLYVPPTHKKRHFINTQITVDTTNAIERKFLLVRREIILKKLFKIRNVLVVD